MGAGAAPAPVGSIGFEPAEGFAIGQDVAASADWSQSDKGAATVTDEISNEGDQSLELSKNSKDLKAVRKLVIPKDGILFVDFKIRPVADPQESPQYSVAVNGAVLGFVKDGDAGTIVSVPSDQKAATATNFTYEIDDDNLAADWIRITIREDAKAKTWDLFLNGKLTLIDQPLEAGTAPEAFQAYSSGQGVSYIDDLLLANVNPLFPDGDKDGIPDAVENAAGTDPFSDDRGGFLRGTNISNIQAFLAGTSFRLTHAGGKGRVIYVDNNLGSDQSSGEMSYGLGTSGPKKTLGAAINQCDPQTVIALMPSMKTYTYQPNASIQNITLLPLGDVILEGNQE